MMSVNQYLQKKKNPERIVPCLSLFVPFAYLNKRDSVCVLYFSPGLGYPPWEQGLHDVGTGVKGQNTRCLRGVRKASRMIDYERKENKLKR